MNPKRRKGTETTSILLASGQKGEAILDCTTGEWEAKVYNPYGHFRRGAVESIGIYKSFVLAKSAIYYFYSICIGSKLEAEASSRCSVTRTCARLKASMAALELRLQTYQAKSNHLEVQLHLFMQLGWASFAKEPPRRRSNTW